MNRPSLVEFLLYTGTLADNPVYPFCWLQTPLTVAIVFARLVEPPLLISLVRYLKIAVCPVVHVTVAAVRMGTKNFSANAIVVVDEPSTEPKQPLPAS